jgi:hypothetical protein
MKSEIPLLSITTHAQSRMCAHVLTLLGKLWHVISCNALRAKSWFMTGSLPFLGAHAWMHGHIAWCTHELWMHTFVTAHSCTGYTHGAWVSAHELWVRIHSHKSYVGVDAPMPRGVILQGTCTLFGNMHGNMKVTGHTSHASQWDGEGYACASEYNTCLHRHAQCNTLYHSTCTAEAGCRGA